MQEFEHKRVGSDFLTKKLDGAPEGNPFYDKKVVLTGELTGMDRNVAACLLQKLGADVDTAISKRTNIVIIGKGCGPSKLDKIIDLLHDGINIKLMNDRIFSDYVKPHIELLNQ